MTGDDEVELKLRVPRDAVSSLLRHPALKPARRGRTRTRRLVSTYFDTADLRLAQAGLGLRLRRDGRRWIQTLKGPAGTATGGALAARPEYEWTLAGGRSMPPVDPVRLATTPWRGKLLKAIRKGISPVFTTDFKRTTVPLALAGDTRALLAVDIGEIRVPKRAQEHISEVEIELQSGDVTHLFALARMLADDLPLALEPRSKAARGVQLRSAEQPHPVRAEDVDLSARPTAATALAAFVRAAVRQIEGNADGVLDDDDPEWVHQMRIGTRRLRACLALLRGLTPPAMLAPIADDTKWLAHALGEARDLDVLATQTLPAVIAAMRAGADPQAAKAMRALSARVGKRRAAARAGARAAVASSRFVRLMLATAELAAMPQFGAPSQSGAARTLAQGARKFALPLLTRRHRKLLRLGDVLPHASAEERHACRLAAKKLRYATEFFSTLFPKKRARAYRQALTRLQDMLGALNDTAVAVRRTAAIAGADSIAAATMRGYDAAHYDNRAGDLAASWKRFAKARTFWD